MRIKAVALAALAVIFYSMGLSACADRQSTEESRKSLEHQVFISGSAAVMPLLRTLASEFSKQERDLEIIFLPDSHSEAGIAGALAEEYDIGVISRERLPGERKGSLRYLHLARDGLVLATNTNVKIADLTSGQVGDIFTAKITNWKEVGGPDAKIVVVDRPEYTSAKLIFRRTFLTDALAVTPDAITVERPWQVTDSLQLIPYSIGYTSLGEIVSENPAVNIVSLNGVAPTLANLKEGRYKFLRPFGLVLGRSPKVATMRFVNFIFSDTGSRIIENSGYVPQRYEIRIGIVPEQNVLLQSQRYEPLAKYLSRKLGERFLVKLKLFSTYIEACRGLVKEEINAAFLGSLAYTTVRKYVDVIARPDYGGVSTYSGIIFVRADSGISGLGDMRGKRLVMGGRTTTAGYVFPMYYFTEHGISDYRNYFSEANFVGTHEDALTAVLHRDADVGAAKDLIYRMMANENPALGSTLKILAESPPVPSNAFVVKKNLELPCFDCHRALNRDTRAEGSVSGKFDLVSTMGEYLVAMPNDAEGKEALAALGNASGFILTTDADYSELYKMLEAIDLEPEQLLAPESAEASAQK